MIVVNPTTIYYHGHDGPFVNAQLVFISTAISEKAFLTFSHRFPCQNKLSDDHYLSFQIDINYSVIIQYSLDAISSGVSKQKFATFSNWFLC